MSQKTILPPEGPAGPGSELPQENSLLLPNAHDACDSPCESPAPEEATESPAPMEQTPEGRGHAAGGNSTNGDLIRTQPQRLPQPATSAQEPGEGEAGQLQNGPHTGLSNGGGIHHGVTHSRAEPRKHPSPVSHKMQRKLQSSLSVHSDSSRRSKGSSSSSHKPGSSPEDCCVHCILACLFCEFLTLCNMVVAQASCGTCTSESCCCCCADDLGDDCNCPCDMDCGIMDACCESSDCLEICMECCGICFPT
ncbi:myoD family inhibitor domain-containing protein [Megalops cyprinoides]|uniref:myoD family inhibitor domain-containing protein n=1 Tax=Megalops cyprinoides TaxID=118141 RepID=UPI001864779A|nr:myoD family inhibitor domain-containing protein [Megalops cyprinoides]